MPRAAAPHLVAESDRLFRATRDDRTACPVPTPRDAAALLTDMATAITAAGPRH